MTSTPPSAEAILSRLIKGDARVAEIKAELTKRKAEFKSNTRRAELVELLRVAIEESSSNEIPVSRRAQALAEMREDELQMTLRGEYDRQVLQAKLRIRSLDTVGSKDALEERLCEVLQDERDQFSWEHVKTQRRAKKEEEDRLGEKPAAVGGVSSPSKVKITDEMRQRMEENRKRALALKAEAAKKKQCVIPSNPYQTKKPPAVTPTPAAGVPSPSRRVHLAPCARCGLDADPNTLCAVWRHKGDLQRERSFGGYKEFRYDCCGFIDPSPCFVGRHTVDMAEASRRSCMTVNCHCHSQARIRRTKKAGHNHGRLFFTCGSTGPDRCGFFRWCDEAHGIPPSPFKKSFDGVSEADFPCMNPLGESGLLHQTEDMKTPEARRKRVIAAVLIRQMCQLTSGETGFVTGGTATFHLIPDVIKIWEEQEEQNISSALIKHLQGRYMHPPTREQILRRFGPLDGLSAPTKEECEKVLTELYNRNKFICSLITVETMGSRPELSEFPIRYIHLSGLGNYLQC